MTQLELLLAEARAVLAVANDRLREQGSSELDMLTICPKRLWLVMEHDWDGDPGDPGTSHVLAITASLDAARVALFDGTEKWHKSRQLRPHDRYEEEYTPEQLAAARLSPEEYDWVNGEGDSHEGVRRWITQRQLVETK